jgi:hypothetical protein
MDNETIAFEVGQTWRTKMDSEFMGARVYVVKVLDNTKVVVAVDNMLLIDQSCRIVIAVNN